MNSIKLPDLTNWSNTRRILQSVSHLIKNIQVKFIQPKPIHLEHSVAINKNGINTDKLGNLGRIFFNYRSGEISLENFSHDKVFSLNVQNHSLNSITDFFMFKFNELKHPIDLKLKKSPDTPFDFSTEQSSQAADILWYFYSALARFKANLFGTMSPLVLWTHHFDFAFLYFPMPDKQTEQDSHMCFGFAPVLNENYKNPYAYFYAWDGLNKKYIKTEEKLPNNVKWNDHYTVSKYDNLREETDPANIFEDQNKQLYDLHISELM